jgi:lysyl-tRNA synthetase class 2
MDKEGFLEVETPVLQNNYGGAEAKPFITTLNALDQKMFLRISLEIELKKLMVGGLERVYEIGKVFRNEGIDRTHNPEFTEIEAYCANWDYNNTMDFIERLFEHVALKLFNTTQIEHTKENGEKIIIDLKRGWQKLTMKESIKKYAHISCDDLSDNQMREILLKSGKVEKKEVDESNRGLLIALLFSTFVEEHLIEPHHIIDHPIETTPLCKPLREPDKDQLVERFESFMLGHEFLNSYSELNNPILQRELLVEQQKRLQKDKTSPPLDEEFIEAITQGMPPCSGWGMGVDRFVMLFTNAHSIRDVIYFPLMKPED